MPEKQGESMKVGFAGWKEQNSGFKAPVVTTFKCEHVWEPAPGGDRDGVSGLTAAQEGYLMCRKCRGYWHPEIGWTREPRRVKKLMADDGVPRA